MSTAISVLPGVPGWQQSKNWPGPFTTYTSPLQQLRTNVLHYDAARDWLNIGS